MVDEIRVVGIGHNRPPRDDTLKTSLPLYQRPNAEDWDIEIKLADLLSARRRSLQKTYVVANERTRAKYRRIKRNPYTCYAVASRVGVTRETLRKWEGCRYSPRHIKLWVGWAKSLGLEFTEILKKVTEGCEYKTGWGYLDVVFDSERYVVLRRDRAARLTKSEGILFEILFKAKGKTVSKETIFARLFEDDPLRSSGEIPEPKIIDVFQCKLNKKLKSVGLEIRTDWGIGKYLNTARREVASEADQRAWRQAQGDACRQEVIHFSRPVVFRQEADD